jgi:drug/metabolite transporter (DMT)-like permease
LRNPPSRELRLAYLAWLVVCIVWGTTYLAIRIGLETLPPFLMTGYRWLAAGVLLIAILKIRGAELPPLRAWGQLALLGILLIGFGNGAVVWAEQIIPSGLAAVLVAASPFWIVGVEQLRADGEPLGRRRAAGLVLGFAGIVILVWPELSFSSNGAFLSGVFATQVACLGWAVGTSYSRRRGREENVFAAAALEMVLAGATLVVAGFALGEPLAVSVNGRTGSAFVYLVVAGSIGAFSAYHYALKHLPVSTVSLYSYVNPIIAVVLGTLVLDEPFTPRVVVAAAFVLAGMALVRSQTT